MSVNVNTDDGLLNAVMESRPLELEAGKYTLTLPPNSPRRVNLSGSGFLDTQVHLEGTLYATHGSRFSDVRLIPQGDYAAVNLDRAAYANFTRVAFTGNVPDQFHLLRKSWTEAEHSGYGVETTDQNDGDNSYKITFNECSFSYLRSALHFLPAGKKATNQTRVYNCEFDSNEVALDGQDIGNLKMRDTHIQLSRFALLVNGNNNKFDNIDIERTETGIHLAAGSYGNYFRTNKIPVTDETGEVDHSRLDQWLASRGDKDKNVFVFYPVRHISRDK
jgi:hypothetical protein